MPNFTQSNQLSPIPGSAGRQSVIASQGPTIGESISEVTKRVGNIADVAGDIYASNRSQVLVNDAIEEVDAAVAHAERQRSGEEAFTPKTPDDVDIDTSEWRIIQSAVANGAMTQEKARLIASSRLRTRISENPLFADKLRQAASNVLGFNIESEPARQYFASLPTQASLSASSRQTFGSRLMEQAQALAPSLNLPVQVVYDTLAQSEFAQSRKQLAESQRDLGAISSQQMFTDFNQSNSIISFNALMGFAQQEFAQNGTVDEVAFRQNALRLQEQEIQELRQKWEGDQTSTEFQRAISTIQDRYKGYLDYVDSVGFDNLTQIGIDRATRAREVLGDALMPTIKFLNQNAGQQAAAQAMEFFSTITDPSRLELLLKNNPALAQYGAILGNPTALKQFGEDSMGVYRKVVTGEALTEAEAPIADLINTLRYRNGGAEEQNNSVSSWIEQGTPTKALSTINQRSPRDATPENKLYFKREYEVGLPDMLNQFSGIIASNPNIEWEVNSDGSLRVVSQAVGGQTGITGPGPTATINRARLGGAEAGLINEAQRLADKINIFQAGISRGWGTEFGTTQSQYATRLANDINQGVTPATLNLAAGLVESGDFDEARPHFERLQSLDPTYSEFTFEEFIEAQRSLAGIGR